MSSDVNEKPTFKALKGGTGINIIPPTSPSSNRQMAASNPHDPLPTSTPLASERHRLREATKEECFQRRPSSLAGQERLQRRLAGLEEEVRRQTGKYRRSQRNLEMALQTRSVILKEFKMLKEERREGQDGQDAGFVAGWFVAWGLAVGGVWLMGGCGGKVGR